MRDERFPFRHGDESSSAGSREERLRGKIEDETEAAKQEAFIFDTSGTADRIISELGIDEDSQAVDDVLELRGEHEDIELLKSSREYFSLLGVADAGSLQFVDDLRAFEGVIDIEPQLMERVVANVKARNLESGRDLVLLRDLEDYIEQSGIEMIQLEQTEEDATFLIGIGVDSIELQRRLAEGNIKDRFEIRKLARLLREGPMQKFVSVLQYEAEQVGEIPFDEVVTRASGVIRRHNRQEAELAEGKPRAMQRWEEKINTIEARRKLRIELAGVIRELRMRQMLENPPDLSGD